MSYTANANRELVTAADLRDSPTESSSLDHMPQWTHINRIQKMFGCSMEAARLAYEGFDLFIPHLWVGTKTRDDGTLKGEGLVYGVMRNLGLGFLTKSSSTADGQPHKAINIKLVEGRNGNRNHQSCVIKFDRLFTRGEDNAGNIAILEHLLKAPVQQQNGFQKHNHLQIEYQPAGPNRHTGEEEPARFWKVFLWRPQEQASKPSTPTSPPKSKVKFTLVKATTATKPSPKKEACSEDASPKSVPYTDAEKEKLAGILKTTADDRHEQWLRFKKAESPKSFDEEQLAAEGFETVGKGGKPK